MGSIINKLYKDEKQGEGSWKWDSETRAFFFWHAVKGTWHANLSRFSHEKNAIYTVGRDGRQPI